VGRAGLLVNNVALKSRDCEILINSVDLSSLLWQAGINLNNAVPTGDDPFPWNSIDIDEFERGEKPTYPMTGSGPRQPRRYLYTNAEGEAVQQVEVQIGLTG
jgi:hypothetical protein